jgi:hypothetical protein
MDRFDRESMKGRLEAKSPERGIPRSDGDPLEQLLAARAAEGSAMPALAGRVQREVDVRETGRRYLKEHPDYFRRKLREAGQPLRRPRDPRSMAAPADSRRVLHGLLLRVSASGSPRGWAIAGSLVAGASCGYLIASELGKGVHYAGLNMLGGLAIASAFACGLAAAVLSQWRTIRGYFA